MNFIIFPIITCVDIPFILIFCVSQARIAQLVEHNLAKVGVAGSNPVSRSLERAESIKDSALFV